MKRFTGHTEPWGSFLDVKVWPVIKRPEKYAGREIFIGSVTDPYNPQEEVFKRTRKLLTQLKGSGAKISIATKSDLILRDLELIKSFPGITDVEAIIERAMGQCNLIWLENLNLRGGYKGVILDYIREKYPGLLPLYQEIYDQKISEKGRLRHSGGQLGPGVRVNAMPELPEVETIRRVIEPQIRNLTIKEVQVRRPEVIAHLGAEEDCYFIFKHPYNTCVICFSN